MIRKRWQLFKDGKLARTDLASLVFEIGHDPLLNEESVQDDLVCLLTDSDPLVRHNALGALAYHGLDPDWNSQFGKQLFAAMEKMLLSDDDEDCRRQAAGSMGSLFKCTSDRKAMARLARVCFNRAESADVKAFAYKSILNIMCVPLKDQPKLQDSILSPAELAQIEDLLD